MVFFYIFPVKVHMSFINFMSESFFPIVEKKAFQFNKFYQKYILNWHCQGKKVRSLLIHGKILGLPENYHLAGKLGALGTRVWFWLTSLYYFTQNCLPYFAIFFYNFWTWVCLCLGVLLVGLLFSIGFFLLGLVIIGVNPVKKRNPNTTIFLKNQKASWIAAR